ncbi:MAG: hypothetical protein FWC22_04255 [Treponema sp.]|nr:hypothetical protein [Treponema sp.]
MKKGSLNIRSSNRISCLKTALTIILTGFAVLFAFSPLYAQRAPININLIVDGSASLTAVKNEITTWVSGRLDQILSDGDRVTVWSAGSAARVIYTGNMSSNADRDALKKSIRDLTAAGNNADFSGALRDASSRQSSPFSYTLLISASPAALSSVLSGTQANLLRFSRVEEFNGWRALVVGLNIDSRVRRAASAFFDN